MKTNLIQIYKMIYKFYMFVKNPVFKITLEKLKPTNIGKNVVIYVLFNYK